MSQEYDDYLRNHISNVQLAGSWLLDNGIIPFDDYETRREFYYSLNNHDESKYSKEEYDAYDDYFYGKEDVDEEEIQIIDSCFDYAWLHHIHQNCHHWQYWILYEDDGKVKPLEMPKPVAYHMLADWWSFSFKEGKLEEVLKWYDSHKDKMILHKNTRALIEDALGKIKVLVEEKEQ